MVTWRRRRPQSPDDGERSVGAPVASLGELCWLLPPDGGGQITPGRVSLRSGRLNFQGERPAQGNPVEEQDMARLVQIDRWGSDVQMLFVLTMNSLDLVRLRFVSHDTAGRFVQQVQDSYRASTGDPFPGAWLQQHP